MMDSSWTDDIPVCPQTGVGSSTNEIYRKDGRRVEMHQTEDRIFHFCVEEFGVSLYGVVDGFGGVSVADFSAKKMPAELLLGQVSKNSSDDVIRDVLRQSFTSVDREYFEEISESLASRIVLRLDATSSNDPKLALLDKATVTGASATVALLIDNKRLFVGNVGDTDAVVARLLPDGQVKAIPLTVDHVLENEDEALRLSHLGLDVSSLCGALAPLGYTRCLGSHRVKGGFKEVDVLAFANDEPVLSTPEIHGPLNIDSTHQFLLIYSRPLAKCLEEILASNSGSDVQTSVSTELCNIVREHFAENSTVGGVAQSVVDKIVRMHRENFEQTEGAFANLSTTSREDVSLLVRNFNSKLASHKSRPARLSGSGSNATMTATNQETIGAGNNRFLRTTRSSTTTESSDAFMKPDREFPVDENGRIRPYVDFSHFHREWNKFKNSQKS